MAKYNRYIEPKEPNGSVFFVSSCVGNSMLRLRSPVRQPVRWSMTSFLARPAGGRAPARAGADGESRNHSCRRPNLIFFG